MSKSLKCRKCSGNHVTLKCGKKKDNSFTKVKMSYLPHDMTYRELRDLIQKDEWGKVGSININTYEQDRYRDKVTVAYIDFYIESEAEYFIKAIHGTKNIDPNYPVFLEVTRLKKRY